MEFHHWLETSSTLCDVSVSRKGERYMLRVDTHLYHSPPFHPPPTIQTQQFPEFHTKYQIKTAKDTQRQSFLGKILPKYRKSPWTKKRPLTLHKHAAFPASTNSPHGCNGYILNGNLLQTLRHKERDSTEELRGQVSLLGTVLTASWPSPPWVAPFPKLNIELC